MPLGIGVVEGVAGGDRADPQRLLELLGRVDGRVDELPVGRRHMRLAADVMPSGPVGGNGRDGHDQVAELEILLQAAAGADAEEALDPELDELFHHDRRRGAAHACRLHRDRLPFPLAGVPEHPALAVALDWIVEVGLGDVLGAPGRRQASPYSPGSART